MFHEEIKDIENMVEKRFQFDPIGSWVLAYHRRIQSINPFSPLGKSDGLNAQFAQ
jgi:hypothetical protein